MDGVALNENNNMTASMLAPMMENRMIFCVLFQRDHSPFSCSRILFNQSFMSPPCHALGAFSTVR